MDWKGDLCPPATPSGEETLSKLEALREAQLWMLRQGSQDDKLPRGSLKILPEEAVKKGDRLRPFFWAAFVLSGDWR